MIRKIAYRLQSWACAALLSAGCGAALAQQVVTADVSDRDLRGRLEIAVEQAVVFRTGSALLVQAPKVTAFTELAKAKPDVIKSAKRRGVRIFACEDPISGASQALAPFEWVPLLRDAAGEALRYQAPAISQGTELARLCQQQMSLR